MSPTLPTFLPASPYATSPAPRALPGRPLLRPVDDLRPPGTRVVVQHGLPESRLVQEWDELACATGATPWCRPGWMLAWWRHLGRGRPLLVLQRSEVDGQLDGVLPLQRVRGGWASPTDWHSPAFDMVARDGATRRALLTAAFQSCSGRLTLDFVDAGLVDELAAVAGPRRCASRVRQRSPWLPLDGWQERVHRGAAADVRRRARRLAAHGDLVLDVQDGSHDLDRLLEETLRLEAAGWRGRRGTAMASSAATRGFYTDVVRWAGDHGLLRLSFLRLDGQALAVDLALEDAGVQYLLKTGYDEEHREHGPGKLLRWRVLEDCQERGLTAYELLGGQDAWKRQLTPLHRELLQVHAFPPTPHGQWQKLIQQHGMALARRARDQVRIAAQGRGDRADRSRPAAAR